MLQADPTAPPRGGEAQRRARRGRLRRRVGIAAAVVLVLALLGAGTAYSYVHYRFNQIESVPVPGLQRKPAAPAAPFDLLVVGSDSRAGLKAGEAAAFGSNRDVAGQRSDVTMIVRVDPGRAKVSVLSIPRDLLVPIAGIHTRNRINAAFDAGPERLVETIQQDFGIPVNHYVLVDFDGFEAIVGALGGITLRFPYPSRDSLSGLSVPSPGCRRLDGAQALSLARSRHFQYLKDGAWHSDPASDLSRIRRQHTLLRVALDKGLSKGLTNPLRANAFIGAIVHHVTKDSALTVKEAVDLLGRFRSLRPADLTASTLPTIEANGYQGYGDVLLLKQPDARQVIDRFLGRSSAPSRTRAAGGGRPAGAPSVPATWPPADFDPRPC